SGHVLNQADELRKIYGRFLDMVYNADGEVRQKVSSNDEIPHTWKDAVFVSAGRSTLLRVRRQERLLCLGNDFVTTFFTRLIDANRQNLIDWEPINMGDGANIGIMDLKRGKAYGVANVFLQDAAKGPGQHGLQAARQEIHGPLLSGCIDHISPLRSVAREETDGNSAGGYQRRMVLRVPLIKTASSGQINVDCEIDTQYVSLELPVGIRDVRIVYDYTMPFTLYMIGGQAQIGFSLLGVNVTLYVPRNRRAGLKPYVKRVTVWSIRGFNMQLNGAGPATAAMGTVFNLLAKVSPVVIEQFMSSLFVIVGGKLLANANLPL
ncbi:hypothetical protein BIW11_13369, partial [Tropilaelaps mercedesae]